MAGDALHAASFAAEPIRPPEPLGGCRLPWKSLIASSWTSTVLGGFVGLAADTAAGTMSASETSTVAIVIRRREARVGGMDRRTSWIPPTQWEMGLGMCLGSLA